MMMMMMMMMMMIIIKAEFKSTSKPYYSFDQRHLAAVVVTLSVAEPVFQDGGMHCEAATTIT